MNWGFAFWSYLLTFVGLIGFYFVGLKKWWAWWINIGCQLLWFIYAIITEQYGFIIASIFYTFIFTKNLRLWMRDRKKLECDHLYVATQTEYELPKYRCWKCGRIKDENLASH